MKLEKIQRPYHPSEVASPGRVDKQRRTTGEAFANVLESKLPNGTPEVTFSAHAAERLASRNIILTEQDMLRLSNAVQKVEQKGGRESLMLMGDMALIVSVKNRTVITTLDNSSGDTDKVFTNIDSAMIMK
ncbi:flagellar protein [bacterium]|nr:flagellar protein [bacterium]